MRVVVCGTGYGASYLQALWNHPSGLRLAGILARGSGRSQALARQWGVPLWRSPDEIPQGAVDAACVAVGWPAGRELALAFLRRGVPVLAEHPMEPGDVEEALAAAREHGTVFHLNSHYADLETVQPFLAACAAARQRSRPLFVSAMSNPRALYSCVDLLARALGTLQPFEIRSIVPGGTLPPLVPLQGTAAGIPLLLQCHRLVSAVDDGSAAWTSHHVVIGFAEGHLILGDNVGPVIWVGAPPPVHQLGPAVLAAPAWSQLPPSPPPSFGEHFYGVRERANRLALARWADQVRTGRAVPEQAPEHLLEVSRAWRAILDLLGPFETVTGVL
ncbi:MAG TPA: Gfo/Idh/MocA family oxidoreductase [Thermoanaerobaculia bacterium]|nr:Gfo/Idh/MocA family oxidoreductase [Thermoanaerobaculia bacterium]